MPLAPEFLHLVYPGPFDAFLYGRASRDPKKKGRSVRAQLQDGRALCTQHGWPIAAEFSDVDRSASRHATRTRDEFEAMIEAIQAGGCRILVAWEASRYYRDLEVYIRLRNVCAAAGVLLCYNGTVYDLSKREDRKATAQDALQAEDEAEGIRDRNLRTVRQNAEKGRPHGPILYGYARRYDPNTGDLVEQVPHVERSLIVQEIFDRAAAAESLRSIRLDLNAREVPTQGGKPWQEYHLRTMLRNVGYLGHRVYQGQDIGEASWPAIISEETFYAVQAILDTPGRNLAPDTQVRHLLTNLAVCGEHPDEPPLRQYKNRGLSSLGCSTLYDTTIMEEKFTAYVEEGVIAWLSSGAAAAAFRNNEDDAKATLARLRHDQLTAQLKEARDSAGRLRGDGTPELSIASLMSIESALAPQIRQAQADSELVVQSPLLLGLLGRPDAETVWGDLTVFQQRAVLREVVTIRLFRARAQGVRTIEPGRVTLSFVGQPGFRGGSRPGRAARPAEERASGMG